MMPLINLVEVDAKIVNTPGPGRALAKFLPRARPRHPSLCRLTLSIAGLAVLAQTFHALFVAVRWIGAGYLVYLGWKMWTAPATTPQASDATRAQNHTSMFLAGLTLALSNPKVMLFYLALLPVIVDLRHVGMLGYLELVLITVAVLAIVLGSYIVLAGRVRTFFNSPRAIRWVHRGSAGIMMGAAAWLAART